MKYSIKNFRQDFVMVRVLSSSAHAGRAEQMQVDEALNYLNECLAWARMPSELGQPYGDEQPTAQQCIYEYRNYVDGEP